VTRRRWCKQDAKWSNPRWWVCLILSVGWRACSQVCSIWKEEVWESAQAAGNSSSV